MQTLVDKLRLDIESISTKRLKRSKIDPFKHEVLALKAYGLSFQQITRWINEEKNVTISQNGVRHMYNHVWSKKDEIN